ncbi:MAG: HAD family hydrolase [Candidatus Eremiobacteraeota bacterium]|nr:HAD family hydrolase [Candidatus Eremiobacteraeota bacterium]
MEFAAFLTAQPSALTYLDYVEAARAAAKTPPALPPLRLAILRNATVETLVPVVEGELLRSGFAPAIHLGDFDAIASETMVADAPLYAFAPDFVVVFQWLETLSPVLATRFATLHGDEAAAEVDRVVDQTAAILRAIRARTAVPVLLNDFPLPSRPTLGILDAQQAHGESATLLALNARLRDVAASVPDVYVLGAMRLAAEIGYAEFFDAKQWQIARAPLGRRAQVALGREIAAFVRALRGRTKKCLVLDCDNTLWGGVIGEDGMDGIALGTTYPGSCYAALQREALNLHARGVILALCSKNDEADVLQVVREHPDMLIREEHLATWVVNWDDKPANLRRIAAELNIGLDALVFVDDNPFEIDFVRRELPEVATVLLPKDRARYAAALNEGAWFDALTLTDEDRARTASYKANAERARLQASATNIADYLASLEIVMTFGPPSEIEVPRVAQLSQKTNQFNLTTRRYTEAEIRALRDADDARVYVMKARDRASELGLVGVLVLRLADGVAEIESCFISCRALGRNLEDAFLAAAANDVFAGGRVQRLIGRYLPNAKNGLCEAFYEKNGLALVERDGRATTWALDAAEGAVPIPPWVAVEVPQHAEMVR